MFSLFKLVPVTVHVCQKSANWMWRFMMSVRSCCPISRIEFSISKTSAFPFSARKFNRMGVRYIIFDISHQCYPFSKNWSKYTGKACLHWKSVSPLMQNDIIESAEQMLDDWKRFYSKTEKMEISPFFTAAWLFCFCSHSCMQPKYPAQDIYSNMHFRCSLDEYT